MRETILGLGTSGQKRPLLESLKVFVQRFAELSGLSADLTVEGSPHQFNPSVEVQLLRIVQESLANARKHAQASRVRVVFSFEGEECRIVVEDDGRGFDPTRVTRGPWPHLGLQSMQERAAAIGARIDVISAPGQGTRVLLVLSGVGA